MNTELSKNAKIFYRNDFFQMMNDVVFGKTRLEKVEISSL